MRKVYEALNKLYFALGEEKGASGKDAESLVSMSDWHAFLALRSYEVDRTNDRSRYFLMGVAAAHRQAAKPPRGKKLRNPVPGKELPPKGKKLSKPGKTKVKKSVSCDYDYEEDYDMEGDE